MKRPSKKQLAWRKKFVAKFGAKKHRKRNRRVNPDAKVLYTLRAESSGKPLFYDGKRFASHPSHIKTFSTLKAAKNCGEDLLERNPVLKKYRLSVHSK